jgi:PEP-CTERM motif
MIDLKHLSIVAAVAALPVTPALAAASSSALLENFSITLYDLDPTDGITPWITPTLSGLGSTVSVNARDAAVGNDSLSRWSQSAWGPVSIGTTVGLAQASASVSGSPAAGTGRLAASGAAQGVVPGTPRYDGTSFSARAAPFDEYSTSFLLSPYTLAVFSATASVRAQTTVGYDPVTDGYESASANVRLSVQGQAPGGGSSGGQSANDSRFVNANATQDYDPLTGDFLWSGMTEEILASPVAVAFTNYSAGSLGGSLQADVHVDGNSAVTAVPEPGSAMLLLAGLAGIGHVVARRRR